mgnify:CR=1 FL=1
MLEAFDLLSKEPLTKAPGQGLRETVILTRSWESGGGGMA